MNMSMHSMMQNKKAWMITAASAMGVAAMGVGAYAVWNSRRMRMMRAARSTGKLLYNMGTVLQSVSGIAEDL